MLTAEQQTHNYIIIRMTKTIYNSIRHSEKNNRGYNIILYEYFGMININSYAITCQMYQFISVRGEHSFRYMTDAIFIDINKSFIDINKYGIVNHIY